MPRLHDERGLLDLLSHCLMRKQNVVVCGSRSPLRSAQLVLSWKLGVLLLLVSHKLEPDQVSVVKQSCYMLVEYLMEFHI